MGVEEQSDRTRAGARRSGAWAQGMGCGLKLMKRERGHVELERECVEWERECIEWERGRVEWERGRVEWERERNGP